MISLGRLRKPGLWSSDGRPHLDADPATVRVLAGGYAEDDGGIVYCTDHIVDADATTIEVLDASFAVLNANFDGTADRQHAYYRNRVIPASDPRSFPPGRAVTGCSESSVFFAPRSQN